MGKRMAVTFSVLILISCKIMDVIALVDVRGLCQNILFYLHKLRALYWS